MVRNTCLDKFKMDMKNLFASLSELYSDVKDIIDENGFDDSNIYTIHRRITDTKRDILRIQASMLPLYDYVTDDIKFTNIRFKLDEILSCVNLFIIAAKGNNPETYNKHLENILAISYRISARISDLATTIKSDELCKEELVLLKRGANTLQLIKN